MVFLNDKKLLYVVLFSTQSGSTTGTIQQQLI